MLHSSEYTSDVYRKLAIDYGLIVKHEGVARLCDIVISKAILSGEDASIVAFRLACTIQR